MLNKAFFVSSTINNSLDVRSTKLDSTLKAIVNIYRKNKGQFILLLILLLLYINFILDGYSDYIIEYINTLRIVYYLSRLSYYNSSKYRITLSKFLLKLYYYFTNLIIDLLRKGNIEIEYLFLLEDPKYENSYLKETLDRLNNYLIKLSILFKDYSKFIN